MSDTKYIRVKADGFIYEYNDRLAVHPSCEVITEQEAYPERFIPPRIAKRGRRLSKGLDLFTDIPEQPVVTDPELAAEARRGWPE